MNLPINYPSFGDFSYAQGCFSGSHHVNAHVGTFLVVEPYCSCYSSGNLINAMECDTLKKFILHCVVYSLCLSIILGGPLSVMLILIPCSLRIAIYFALAYWQPLSEWWMSWTSSFAVPAIQPKAISSVLIGYAVSSVSPTLQPTISSLYASRIKKDSRSDSVLRQFISLCM